MTSQTKTVDKFKAIRWDIVAVISAATAWAVWSAIDASRQGTWLDETNYIVRAWWYISGIEKPYSQTDATRYVPLYFFSLGFWQSLFGYGVIISRLWSVFLTGINICLLATLVLRLRGTWWAVAFAVLVFSFSEESTFYFSSATPYALVVFLQLCALNVVIDIERGQIWLRAIILGTVLTALYFTRPEMSPFIGLILGTIIARTGKRGLAVIAAIGAEFFVVFCVLAYYWGQKFIFVSMYLPGLTEALIKIGALPELFPNAVRFSHTVYYDQPASFYAMVRSAFRLEILRDWVAYHHLQPVVAAIFAMGTLIVLGIARLRWLSFFTTAYWLGLLYYLVAGQLQCSICVQGYLNYIDYFAAIAGALALQAVLDRGIWPQTRVLAAALAGVVVLVPIQSFLLRDRLKLPSVFHQNMSFPKQVDLLASKIRNNIPNDVPVGIVGVDYRLLLALTASDLKFSAWSLVMPLNYRRIAAGLVPEQVDRVRQEIEALTDWTDLTADRWLSAEYQRVIVVELPKTRQPDWVIWYPGAPKIVHALSRCFEKEKTISVSEIDPLMTLSVYRRRSSGAACLDLN